MKTCIAFAAWLLLGVVPACADDADKVATLRGETEILELQRDVDRTLLREAMLLAGRERLKPAADRPDTEEERKRAAAVLENFIREKTDDVVRRTAELRKKGAELSAAEKPTAVKTVPPPVRAPKPHDAKERQALVEKLGEAQIEVELLQMQTNLYQQPLTEALQALAQADFAASNDRTQQGKADDARKRFDEARARYLRFSKRLQMEQEALGELQMKMGSTGMMGGMGGGMR